MNSPSKPTGESSAARSGQLALRFISGKYQGGEFPLSDGTPIIVGRSSDLDMVLVEEMVSRKHARIEQRGGVIHIEDMGSTNGTFVNGERIQKAELSLGDRVLIGTSILKVIALDTPTSAGGRSQQPLAFGRETVRQPKPSGSSLMTGNLEEIPLPDLMQLFGTARKSGVLVIHSRQVGRMYLSGGTVVYAEIEGSRLRAAKAAYRMVSWTQGTFSLEPPIERSYPETLDLTPQALLMEGFRQSDELSAMRSRIPNEDDRLTLKTPLEAPLHDLEQSQLDVLQVLINAPNFQTALDRSPKSDLETAQDVVDLVKRGYIQIVN